MKAYESVVNGKALLDRLNKLRSGGWRDPDLLQYKVGEETFAKNRIRLVGEFESCRLHYLQDYIGEGEAVDRVPVCPGGPAKCPVCRVVAHLYSLGTEAAKDKARDLKSTERHFINVFPLWEYDWKDDEERWLVLPFGYEALNSLTDMVADYGPPNDWEEGYDTIFSVKKKKGGWGNSYKFSPRMKKRSQGSKGIDIVSTDIPEDVLNQNLVDLTKYITPPTDEQIELLAEKFEMEFIGKGKRRSELSDEAEEEDEEDELDDELDDEDDDVEDMLCFGDSEVYDSQSTACGNCPEKKECRREVRSQQLKKRKPKPTPKGKSRRPTKKRKR